MILTANFYLLLSIAENGKSKYIKSNYDEIKRFIKRALIKEYRKMAMPNAEMSTKYGKAQNEDYIRKHFNIQFGEVNKYDTKWVKEAHFTEPIEMQDYSQAQMFIAIEEDGLSIEEGKTLFERFNEVMEKREVFSDKFHTFCLISNKDDSKKDMYMFYNAYWTKLDGNTEWKDADY
jgi:hypothetical protein